MRRLVLVCAFVMTGELAAAQPATFVASEASCAHTETSGQRVACGNYFAAQYTLDPSSAFGDKTLYNAAVAYEDGQAITAAVTMFNLLRTSYPNSPLVPKALARVGMMYGQIAFYDRAAAVFEEYAQKYAGERDAWQAMRDAVFYRRGLRQDEKALADSNYFLKTFGAKYPAQAADVAWGMIDTYEAMGDRDAALESARDYVVHYAKIGDGERLVIAYERIGEWMAAKSCPVRLVDGLCVKVERMRAKGTCGDAVVMTRVVRRARDLEQALLAFTSAQREFEKRSGTFGHAGRDAGARAAYGHSFVVTASLEIEQTALRVLAAAKPYERATNEYIKSGAEGFSRLDKVLDPITALKDPTATVEALWLRATYLEAQANSLERGLCATTKEAAKEQTVEALRKATAMAFERCAVAAVDLAYPDGSMACIRGIERTLSDIHVPFRELVNREPKSGSVTVLEMLRE